MSATKQQAFIDRYNANPDGTRHPKVASAYAWLKANGYTCNASHYGFSAAEQGKVTRDNPFSIVTNIIENRRWAEGFQRAKSALRVVAQEADNAG